MQLPKPVTEELRRDDVPPTAKGTDCNEFPKAGVEFRFICDRAELTPEQTCHTGWGVIYLPATKEKIVEIKEAAKKERNVAGTILFVDDDPTVAAVVKRLLEELGYDVLVAHSGDAALEGYRQNKGKIDLVLLDMIMPGISGGDVFDKLRELNPNVKVLLLSGYGLQGRAEEIMDRGCNGFVQMPFSLNELSEKIHEITDQK
ncbi:MAG: response regulator [bacterium]